MQPLNGSTALVTGAERGIGKAIALRLAADGADVVINFLEDCAAAAAVAATITGRGGRARTVAADVSDPAQVKQLFADLGRVDILVNNAGIGLPGALGEIDPAVFDRVFAVNVRGPMLCAQEALARMPRGGRIVNVSSSTTEFPLPGMSAYTASKAAVRALTAVWAKELGARGITVNSVMPGPTSPGMADLAPVEVREAVARASPFGRLGAAEEIADAVAFLCGPDARWVSGHHLMVNGAASA
jgi:3-oxoacyl-[acyl-carrier protein] reductase